MVLIDAEDNLVTNAQHLIVVGTEQFPVVVGRLQLVAQVDDLLAVFSTLGIVRRASINTRIQIELGKNHVSEALTCTIFLRIGGQLLSTLFHVLDHPVEQVSTADLLWVGTTNFRSLVGERHVAKHVDGMQIAQSADSTCFGSILLHGGIAGVRSFVNLTD